MVYEETMRNTGLPLLLLQPESLNVGSTFRSVFTGLDDSCGLAVTAGALTHSHRKPIIVLTVQEQGLRLTIVSADSLY
jgi:hypothetical protein